MAFNIYSTHTLLMAVQLLTPPSNFLKKRYFPTNEATDIFKTEDVLIEYRDGSKKLAPFVAPRKGGVTMMRQGSKLERFTPPRIAPKRGLTVDDLETRGFGEALFTNKTPEERERLLVIRDVSELSEAISRREEVMCAETMLTNGCVMRHIADDKQEGDDKEIRFYEESKNPAQYTPTVKWDQEGNLMLKDLAAMSRMLTTRGLPAADFVCSPDLADVIINDSNIQKLLDNRRYELGAVKPETLTDSATVVAVLNINGRLISIISYDESYTDDDGKDKLYIPSGKGVLTAPGAGKAIYGAVTQLEQTDNHYHTYAGRRVPKYLANAENDTRSIMLTSRPIMLPKNKNPFIVIDALTQ
jgi:hypothetical protein